MKKLLTALAVASLASVSSLAYAAEGDFAKADADANGELTFEEGVAVHSDWTQEAFNELDTDGNGSLSQAEYDAAMMKKDG